MRWAYESLGTKSKPEAQREMIKLEQRLAPAPLGDLTLAQLWAKFAEWAAEHRAPATIESRKRALERLREYFGVTYPEQVTPEMAREYKRRYAGMPGVGNRAVNEAIGALRALWGRALREGWIEGVNPFEGIESLPERRRAIRWLDSEQIDAALWAAALWGWNAWAFWNLGIYAGLRKGEALAARWDWLDFEKRQIHVMESDTWRAKDRESRALPLAAKLADNLKPFQRAPYDYIVAPDKLPGSYKYRYDVRKMFAAVAKAAGVPWATPHTLRHTFASQLLGRGVDIHKVSSWLGHTDIRITYSIYYHAIPGDPDIDKI